jgi:hypothetical protein
MIIISIIHIGLKLVLRLEGKNLVGFEVFTAVVVKSIIFWDMTLFSGPITPMLCQYSPMFLGGPFQDHTLRSCLPIGSMI